MISSASIGSLQIHRTTTYALTSWSKTINPKQTSYPRARSHGGAVRTRWYDSALYHLEGVVRGDTTEDALEAFDALVAAFGLADFGAAQLTYTLMEVPASTRFANVRQASTIDAPMAGLSTVIRYAVDLEAEDPRSYGITQNTASFDPTLTSGGGINLPITFPIVFSGTENTGSTVVNGGNYEAPFQVRITGPATNPVVTNETTGYQLVTQNLSLSAGDLAIIDTKTRVLTAGGIPRQDLISAGDTEWGGLKKGINLIRVTDDGAMITGVTEVDVVWFDAFITTM